MSIRTFRDINRKKTKVINVGKVRIGGDNPISVQSMTNTLTTNIKATTRLVTTSTVRATRIIKATDQKIKATLLVQKRIISRKTLKDLIVLQIKTRTIKIIKTVNKIKKLTLRVN